MARRAKLFICTRCHRVWHGDSWGLYKAPAGGHAIAPVHRMLPSLHRWDREMRDIEESGGDLSYFMWEWVEVSNENETLCRGMVKKWTDPAALAASLLAGEWLPLQVLAIDLYVRKSLEAKT